MYHNKQKKCIREQCPQHADLGCHELLIFISGLFNHYSAVASFLYLVEWINGLHRSAHSYSVR